jgi:GNAT superfamily N-acetyltransferase
MATLIAPLSRFIIRPSTRADHGAILDLYRRSLKSDALVVGAGREVPEDLVHLRSHYWKNVNKGGAFLVGELDGKIIAFGGMKPLENDPDYDAQITRLRVDPGYEGKRDGLNPNDPGYMGKMVQALRGRARDAGVNKERIKDIEIQPYTAPVGNKPDLQKRAILALCERTRHETKEPRAFETDLADIPVNYRNNRGEFLLGTIDGRLVSMVGLMQKSDTQAELKRMRTDPDFRKLGYAGRMMDAIEARAKELGYRHVVLETTTEQKAAHALYRSRGYRSFTVRKVEIDGRAQREVTLVGFDRTLPSTPAQRRIGVGRRDNVQSHDGPGPEVQNRRTLELDKSSRLGVPPIGVRSPARISR